jgi:hypothetical protein
MSADILGELDALIDLSMALQELEHGLMASLAQSSRVHLEELMETLLFQHYLFLCRLHVLLVVLFRLCRRLHLVDLVKLQLNYPRVQQHLLWL